MEADCPRFPLHPYNVRAASNGPIRRDATRHKVLLSDGFHEFPPAEVEVQDYTPSATYIFQLHGDQVYLYTQSASPASKMETRQRNFHFNPSNSNVQRMPCV